MKKQILTFAFAIALTLNLSAQSKQPVKDTGQVTDSTALITLADYNQFAQAIVSELPAKYADVIRQYWIAVIQNRIQLHIQKNKKK